MSQSHIIARLPPLKLQSQSLTHNRPAASIKVAVTVTHDRPVSTKVAVTQSVYPVKVASDSHRIIIPPFRPAVAGVVSCYLARSSSLPSCPYLFICLSLSLSVSVLFVCQSVSSCLVRRNLKQKEARSTHYRINTQGFLSL